MARTGRPTDLVPRNLRALHGALEHSVTIQMSRLQGLMDDLVARGSLTRAEADNLLGQLVSTGKAYSSALMQVLDTVTAAVSPVRATAGLVADTVRQAPKLVPGRRKPTATPPHAPTTPPADNVESLVVPDLDALTVVQVKARLAGLKPADLRRVREREAAGKNRKGVLGEIDRLLKG